MKQCPYCGSELNDDARFCVECGKPLPTEAPAEAPVVEEAPAVEPVVEEAPAMEPMEAPAEVPVEPVIVPAAAPVVAAAAAVEEPAAPAEAPAEMPVITEKPSRKQMLSTFQYFALSLLYALPVIGLVFLFIFGAGHPKNGTLKRFSAALLILRLLFWIAVLALAIVAMVKNGRLLTDALGQLVPAVENLLKAIFA